jgi:hypothetical protein
MLRRPDPECPASQLFSAYGLLDKPGGLSYPWPRYISQPSPNSATTKQAKQYRP